MTSKHNLSKRGSVVVQVFIIIAVAALVGGGMLLLVHLGAFESSSQDESVSILNTEFIPLERVGDVQILQVDFCKLVDSAFNCFTKTTSFSRSEEVYVRFLVATSPYQGQIMLVRNYRIVDPSGVVVLALEEGNEQVYEQTQPTQEAIAFADKITFLLDDPVGEYTIEIIVENPLLNKKVALVRRITITS